MKKKVCVEGQAEQDDLYGDFGDFPDAKDIKSTQGNDQRPVTKVDIHYKAPAGFKFQFGYDSNGRPGHLLIPDDQETDLVIKSESRG